MTNLLLGLIVVLEATRLYLTHRAVTQKNHFKQKLDGVGKMIWDLDFKKYKTREIREDIRKLYDNAKSRKYGLEEQIKNWPADKDAGDKARLEDEVVRLTKDIERNEAQLKDLDMQVEGAKPSPQYPDGVSGINDQIDSLMELKQMLKDWTKTL